MPLFKVSSSDRCQRVLVCAAGLQECLEGSIKKLKLTATPPHYNLYDDSDGTLIDDSETLTALAEESKEQGHQLKLIILSSNEKWKRNSDSVERPIGTSMPSGSPPSPSTPVSRLAQAPPPGVLSALTSLPITGYVTKLKKALASPPHVQFKNMTRTRRDVVKSLAEELKGRTLEAGEMRRVCERLRAAVPQAFTISIGSHDTSCFHKFVKSLYSAVDYARGTDISLSTPSRRRRRAVDSENENPDDPEERVSNLCLDSNGCAMGMWERPMSPEDKDLYETLRLSLMEVEVSATEVTAKVENDASVTYDLQRWEINRARSARDWQGVFARWPLFKNPRLFLIHANALMGKEMWAEWHEQLGNRNSYVDFMRELCQNANANAGADTRHSKIMKYLELQSDAEQSQESRVPSAVAVIPLTLSYFKEKEGDFFHFVETFSLEQDFPSDCPLLLLKGSSLFDPQLKCAVLVRKSLLINTDSFIQGSLITILAYFVFNISYPRSVAKTLEFLQRFFLGVNPQLQHRTEKKKKSPVNASVATLAGKMKDYETAHSRWMLS